MGSLATEAHAMHTDKIAGNCHPPSPRWGARLACLLMLACVAHAAHAAPVYRCIDAAGHVAFADTPCAASTRQTEIALRAQPAIGAPGEHGAGADESLRPASTPSSRARVQHRARENKSALAWECRAADGEVFYRLSRCPASIAGDGVVRGDGDYATGKRRRSDAWGRIHVHGTKIARSEACQRIHAITADSRDGHQHDERASTYDHLMGRDPCAVP